MGSEDFKDALQSWFQDAPSGLDLTNADHLHRVTQLAEEILSFESDPTELAIMEREMCDVKEKVPLLLHLGIKVARSRAVVARITQPLHVSVVFAAYEEHERILSSAENPVGEDFLRRKVDQLQWLFGTHVNFSWELVMVDDGCPENSGRIAQQIIEADGLGDRARVLFLADAVDANLPVTRPMRDTSESQKGGSICYGMWQLANERPKDHVVVFTDADPSSHLGQVGLLLDGIVNRDQNAAIGSRRERNSIAIAQGKRNTRGKLFIYLWKRMLRSLDRVIDTQCGFKAFRAELVPQLTSEMIERSFAFDIELLLRTELARTNSIEKVGIAWIDSGAAASTTSLQPYLSMLNQIVAMYRRYLEPTEEGDRFAAFIERLDEDSWNALCEDIPSEIAEREPAEFGTWCGVSVEALEERVRLLRG